MSKLIRLACFAVVLALSACDVQVRDETPGEYPANHDVGMYEIKASVSGDSLVTPGSVVLFAIADKQQKIPLTPNRDGSEYTGMYSIRCKPAFPVQFLAAWRVQGLATKQKLVPEHAREVKLTHPPLTREATIDTSGKAPKGGWEGGVAYRFITAPDTHITGAHVEPTSQDAVDVSAAKPIKVVSAFPVDAPCGTPTEVRISSSAQKAHGTLVIDTDHPSFPHWQTTVEFAPK